LANSPDRLVLTWSGLTRNEDRLSVEGGGDLLAPDRLTVQRPPLAGRLVAGLTLKTDGSVLSCTRAAAAIAAGRLAQVTSSAPATQPESVRPS
jgi:hypothetical protein